MSNITTLPTQRCRSHESTIEMLERYLERAKAGLIVSVGIAAVTSDGRAQYGHSDPDDGLRLLGAVRLLDTFVALSLDEEGE